MDGRAEITRLRAVGILEHAYDVRPENDQKVMFHRRDKKTYHLPKP